MLTSCDPDDFENNLADLEASIQNMDVNSIPQEDFVELFNILSDKIDTGITSERALALRVINYIIALEILVEDSFSSFVASIKKSLLHEHDVDLATILESVRHADAIFSDYMSRLEAQDEHPEYFPVFVAQMQRDLEDLYFFLQEQEKQREQKEEVSDLDQTTDFGPIPAADTSDPRLQCVRWCLESLHEGRLGGAMLENGYVYKVSPVDSDLEIMGRFDLQKKHADGCDCCH